MHLCGITATPNYAQNEKAVNLRVVAMINALKKEGKKGEVTRSRSVSKRIQFEFSADALERMEKLKEKTHARSYAELIRDALRAYEWMVEEKEAGNEVGAIRGKEIVNVVKLLF
jgi:hypothetical protein